MFQQIVEGFHCLQRRLSFGPVILRCSQGCPHRRQHGLLQAFAREFSKFRCQRDGLVAGDGEVRSHAADYSAAALAATGVSPARYPSQQPFASVRTRPM